MRIQRQSGGGRLLWYDQDKTKALEGTQGYLLGEGEGDNDAQDRIAWRTGRERWQRPYYAYL